MVLSDRTIRSEIEAGNIVIDPLGPNAIQPASVDLRLGHLFRVFRNSMIPFIVEIDDDHPFILHPGEFALAVTFERVKLPDFIVGRLEGKSSLGRLGLLIHSTAGYVDPGWDGALTLELSNVANLPITLYHRMKVSQISFLRLTEPAEHPYGSKEAKSKYQGQVGPTPSKYYLNFRD
jgi:dCTP deaminase